MSQCWFYRHQGKTHGPLSVDEIRARASKGLVDADDLVWPKGIPEEAVPASAALNFSSFPAQGDPVLAGSGKPLPDWLADVSEMERKGPHPPLEPTEAIPDWLDDLRVWFGLDVYTAVKRASQKTAKAGGTSTPTQVAVLPSWVESWIVPEQPRAVDPAQILAPRAAPAAPVVTPALAPATRQPAPASPVVSPPAAIPVHPPAAKPIHSPPAPRVPESLLPAAPPAIRRPVAKPATSVVPQAPKTQIAAEVSEVSEISSARAEATPPVLESVDLVAETTLEETGFDLKTGKILDAERFAAWKQREARPASTGQPGVSNASFFEVFRKARNAIAAWVDEERNTAKVQNATMAVILADPEVQAILNDHAHYGKGMQEKLAQHLEFVVENRRRYFKAVGAASRRTPGIRSFISAYEGSVLSFLAAIDISVAPMFLWKMAIQLHSRAPGSRTGRSDM
jgi:hypothetical protein